MATTKTFLTVDVYEFNVTIQHYDYPIIETKIRFIADNYQAAEQKLIIFYNQFSDEFGRVTLHKFSFSEYYKCNYGEVTQYEQPK